jgi:hypothetical protein
MKYEAVEKRTLESSTTGDGFIHPNGFKPGLAASFS